MAKPIPEHVYLKYLRMVGLKLEKGKIDYNLYENDHFLGTIKIVHGKGKKREVSPGSVRKTQKICEDMGLEWPPRKK